MFELINLILLELFITSFDLSELAANVRAERRVDTCARAATHAALIDNAIARHCSAQPTGSTASIRHHVMKM